MKVGKKIKFNPHPGSNQSQERAKPQVQQPVKPQIIVYSDDDVGKMVAEKIKQWNDYQKVEEWILKTFEDRENCYSAGFSLCYAMATDYIYSHNLVQKQRLESLIGIINPDFIGVTQANQVQSVQQVDVPYEEAEEPVKQQQPQPLAPSKKKEEDFSKEIDEALGIDRKGSVEVQ